MIDILDFGIKPKFALTGTKPLKGGIGSYNEVVIDFIVHWELENVTGTFADNHFATADGSNFITAGFQIGDTITITGSGAGNDGNYTITNVTNFMIYVTPSDSSSVSSFSFNSEVGAAVSIYGTTPITAIDFYYGLVENAASSAYVSLLDGETQRYRATGLYADDMGVEALSAYTTNKSWLTGSTSEQANVVIEEAGIGTSGASTGYEQRFIITHNFHNIPVTSEDWEDSDGNLDLALVPYLAGVNSLKYVPRIVAGFNTSGTDHTTDTGNLSTWIQNGDNGFYGEHNNGGPANYELTSIIFDGGDRTGLSKNISTPVEIVITRLAGNYTAADARFDVYVYQVPNDSEDYLNNTTTVWENFNVSNLFLIDGDPPANDNLITDATVTIVGDEATIAFDYGASNNDYKYIIFVDVGELNDDAATNDHHPVEAQYGQFELFIDTSEALLVENAIINDHPTNELDLGYSDAKCWVEDGILTTCQFHLKRQVGVTDEFTQLLNAVSVNISCEHVSDSTRNFALESISLSNPENTTRGYHLYTGDPKNYLTFNEQTGTADYRTYLLQYGTKIRWMDWATLGVTDPDFTTSTENWSNYDFPPDWQLYINIVVTSDLDDGTNTEQYQRTHKILLNVKNYDEFDGCEKIGTVRTYLTSTGGNLGGKISKTANTTVIGSFYGESLFPCVYEDITSGSHEADECEFDIILSGSGSYSLNEGLVAACPDYYGILELDIPNAGGPPIIHQISTVITDTETPSPWIGELSNNRAKMILYPYASPPRIDVIATLDYTQLNTSLPSYNLSAKLGKQPQTICNVSTHYYTQAAIGELTGSAFPPFTVDELLIFNDAVELSSIGEATHTVATDLIEFNPKIDGRIKVCCSKNAITGTIDGSGEFQHASLIGLTIDDFIAFTGPNGREITTRATTTFSSVTGTLGGLVAGEAIKISFHVALATDTIASPTTSYVNAAFTGFTLINLLVFINGLEAFTGNANLSGTTLTLPAALTGQVKIIEVYQ